MEKNLSYFMEVFIEELEKNPELRKYHRIINSPKSYLFRKSYLQQRLQYLIDNISQKGSLILDVGCGYGTSSFLLGLLGYRVIGTTIEYYFNQIQERIQYWSKYFDTSNIHFKYENIFRSKYDNEEFDIIIAQDTLHHLEPIDEALQIFHKILKSGGKLIVSEENGNNIFCNIKHFKERGFKRIIEIYDEKLDEKILFGNENTRSMSSWSKILSKNNFIIESDKIEYLRLFPPFFFRRMPVDRIISIENAVWKKSSFLRKYFYFGINFVAIKK